MPARAAPPRVDSRRCRALNSVALPEADGSGGTVLYWMSRDQRAHDNWALLRAQELALDYKAALHVCFCLVPKFVDATFRHYDFMLRGLHETSADLAKLQIPFELKLGQAKDEVPKLVRKLQPVRAVICDMSPLRVPAQWACEVAKALARAGVPLIQVDAHNVVPVWEASDKQEVGARTLRPKIMGRLGEFLTQFPPLRKHRHVGKKKLAAKPFDLKAALASVQVDRSVSACSQFTPGPAAGRRKLDDFIKRRLKVFGKLRNDPTKDALSGLSPWVKFGQISAQRCALSVMSAGGPKLSAEFIEESVVRRELADNYCFYNSQYDSFGGAARWAVESLKKHAKDKREHVYTRAQLEKALTHDDLWNAAQRQMVTEGKMHGFLRMYWAKKVLEWMKRPEEALATVIYLNDRYSMDGRDPNGYVGCMWSVCGVHDMGWSERPIFGKIRYMNYEGCKRKFKVAEFESRYPGDAAGAAAGEPATRPAKRRRVATAP